MRSVDDDERKERVPGMRAEHGGSERACCWTLLSDEW